MRIALLSPLFESVPPRLYGGTERVVANLCRGFTELGHDVTLFASGDSTATAKLIATAPTALRLAGASSDVALACHIAQLGDLMHHIDDFDVVHNHNDILGLPLTLMGGSPVVTTLHGRLDIDATLSVLRRYGDAAYISISRNQRLPVPELNWIGNVYHGLALEDFRATTLPGKYLAFLGRISPEKRPDLAIEIAKQSGVPLKIAAKVSREDQDYYDTVIKPEIDGRHIEYVGEVAEHEKSEFLGGALGMVFPIEWPEPFGIAPVEAWACGTPVLARPFGSVPELHREGVTGYIRREVAELAALVPRLEHFDRARCRAYAERHFSLHRMCGDYLDVYRRLQRGNAKSVEKSTKPTRRQALQSDQSDGRQWGLLHPLRSAASGHQQDRLEG